MPFQRFNTVLLHDGFPSEDHPELTNVNAVFSNRLHSGLSLARYLCINRTERFANSSAIGSEMTLTTLLMFWLIVLDEERKRLHLFSLLVALTDYIGHYVCKWGCSVWLYAALKQHGDTGNRHEQWRHFPILRPWHEHHLPLRTGIQSSLILSQLSVCFWRYYDLVTFGFAMFNELLF